MQQFTGYIARPGDAPYSIFEGSLAKAKSYLLRAVRADYNTAASRKLCARISALTEDTRNWVSRLDGLEFGLLKEAKK